MNSAALKKAGIAKEMQSYMDREIPKDSSGDLTGELPDFPAGLYAIDKVVPLPTPDQEDQWIAAGQKQRNEFTHFLEQRLNVHQLFPYVRRL